jgi:hypothetical protein
MRRLLLLLAALCLPASPAFAWWEYGHEMIARIAYLEANPATKAGIDRLLRQSKLLETPTCPARTIAEASIWPDCVKPLGDRFSYAYSWHYQDFDICKPFDPKAACADGNCVTRQIERDQRLLADRKVPVRERLMALVFLVHFVGDLHQPLHAAERDHDLGGNKLKVDWGRYHSNLHSVWDGLLPERVLTEPPVATPRSLVAGITSADRSRIEAGKPIDWAEESWKLARDVAYPDALHAPACPVAPDARGHLDEADIAKLAPVIREQMAKGGIRLARMLDDAFAGKVPPRPKGG